MKKHTWKIVFALVIVLFGGSIVFSQHVAQKANEGVVIEPHIKGNPDAAVTLVEYSDFQCPACGRFFPEVQAILAEHGDVLSFEYRHFPLISIHPYAVPAARAAEAAAQQGKFFEMHDTLFENQSVWSNSTSPTVYFEQYAEEIGLDLTLFKRHMNASVIDTAVRTSFREAQERGLSSTPTFFLNGEKMEFDTFAAFNAQIEAALGLGDTATDTVETTESSDAGIKFGL